MSSSSMTCTSTNPVPIINFACPSSGKTAACLMADLEGAVKAVGHWAPIEDELNIAFNKSAPSPERTKSMPLALRKAKREVRRAHKAWTSAEQAISNYQPQSLQEAVELLAFCSRDSEIFPNENDLKRVMQNAAGALSEYTRP